MQIARTLEHLKRSTGMTSLPNRLKSLLLAALCGSSLLAPAFAFAAPLRLAQTVAPPAPVESAPLPPPPGAPTLAPTNPAAPGSPPSVVAPPAASAPLSPLPPSGTAGTTPQSPPTGSVPPVAPGAPPVAVPQGGAQQPNPQQGVPPNPAPPAPSQAPSPPNPPLQGAVPPEALPVAPPPAAALPQPGGQLSTSAPPRDLSNEPDLIELVIEPRPVLILQAEASNEDAFPALVAALNRLGEEARKAGVLITGRPFAVIDLTDDKKFKFQAMLPVENTATTPPIPGLRYGQSPSGQAIRFKYAGAYEDNTYVYESIEAYIEERDIKARPYAIEEFLTDPKDASDASLQMFIYYLRE